mgnify:FL=1
MNIFYLDKCPIRSANYQYNKHIVKMVLESAQMLCTAHHQHNNGDNVPYKPAYVNHPSTIWCRQNSSQYKWLYKHFIALGVQYNKRYGKIHTAIQKCAKPPKSLPPNIANTKFIQPPQCMPDQYKHKCSIQAYWNYYIAEKNIVASKKESVYTKKPQNDL